MTERRSAVRAAVHAAVATVCGLVALPAAPGSVAAQAPLFLVGPETEVAAVDFRFDDTRSVERAALRRELALRGPGPLYGTRSLLGKLPLIPSPSKLLFDPPSLLRDLVRLERFYRDQGFPDVSVTYDAVLDTTTNAVDVTYVIREGRPVVLDTVIVSRPAGAGLTEALPAELRQAWGTFETELAAERGQRLSSGLRARLRDRVVNWLRDRGYPYPTASLETEPTDRVKSGDGMRLTLTVDPGTRMRVGSVTVSGNRRLEPHVLRREVPLAEGDWFSRARLAEGQSELFGLDMVRVAVTGTEPDSTRPDHVDVRLRVTEGALHLLSGRTGWSMGSGVSADVSWSHRNFTGGARTLEISTLARTGLLAPEATAARRYGFSVSLRQPWLFHHRVEGVARPFVEYRDDLRDESVQFGMETSALYRMGSRRHVTLRYSLTSRKVIRAGAGVVLGQDTDLVSLLTALDTLDLDRRTSSFSATGRWARASGPGAEASARPDWSVFTSTELAGPGGLSTVEYGKLVAEATALLPVGAGLSLRGRVGGGTVRPFGGSVPAPDGSNRLETYFKLRDAVLTAGGSQDVRGWGTDLLGPKAPDMLMSDEGTVSSARYVPLGGLARWTGSLQVEIPLPFFGRPHGLHTFLDAGRVWTPDERFLPTDQPLIPDQLGDEVRLGTGLGISLGTPVGLVQLDVGYKLNPSLLDLRDPAAVGQALVDELPVADVPAREIRRWHLHLSIGGIS
ncbi:MAG: BamA/TamA family outer membrane protein [Gemmatimonadota bacterium]|nr:BamA/TamA family outer membrane protein [Gemmatimonadota bacterium]